MKKIRKIKWLNIILILLFLISAIIFIISITNIVKWQFDNNKTSNVVKKIEENTSIKEIDDNNTEIIKQEEKIDKNSPYWDYIKIKLIDVNFNVLKEINKDTVGWIQVAGTNINYPVVQDNNTYYLNHSFDKTFNNAGWVFVDYRNNLDSFDQNTIIYAHGRKDTTMFGSLKNVIKNSWLENKDNHIIKLATEENSTLWQIFSVYIIDTTNDYLITNFSNEKDYNNFLNKITKRSIYNFNTNINNEDKILTLSTCYNQTQKLVVHAKLIKKTIK